MKNSKLALSINDKGYLKIGHWKVHDLVWEQFNGKKPKGYQIDHINGNVQDNRIENLRLATYAENQWNAKTRVDNKSGVKGVCWHKATKKWRVEIKKNKKLIGLGVYSSLEEATKVITEARKRLHGEFARHI